jgi:AcrR family transcriptional regulator
MLGQGQEVTIAAVAKAALVSPATAYRYFSQPHQLVLETGYGNAAEVVHDLPEEPAARLDEAVRRLAGVMFDDEPFWRARLSALLELAREKAANPDDQQPLRSGRMYITSHALAGLEDTLGPDLHRRLTMALMLVYGLEAMIATRDACGLEREEATEVMRWAAQALLQAALAQAASLAPENAADPIESTPS